MESEEFIANICVEDSMKEVEELYCRRSLELVTV
jgi:hypothetical protein